MGALGPAAKDAIPELIGAVRDIRVRDSALRALGRMGPHARPAIPILSSMLTRIAGDLVTLDGNHPLAGKNLHFQVEVTGVRAATTAELSHGHVHGPGGHHH